MRTDSRLKAALLSRLGVTPQRLSQRVKKVKSDNGPMSTADATYVIAHNAGLDLTRYLDTATVDKVRTLVSPPHTRPLPAKAHSKGKTSRAGVSVTVSGTLPAVEHLLSPAIARDARTMAKLYPVYYTLENTLRMAITKTMEKAHGKDWWEEAAPSGVQKQVADRQAQEKRTPWHGKRGAHEIFYSDFKDLRAIVEKNWDDFKELFPSRAWITQRLEELEHPRNVLAHHNPIENQDGDRVHLYFKDLIDLFNAKKNLFS